MKNVEAEMTSMKAMMAQLFQTGTKLKRQQHSEPSGMAKDTVATPPILAAAAPTSKHKPPKEPHQRAKQDIETMDTCDLMDQITDCPIPSP